jgi:hypothetical protein
LHCNVTPKAHTLVPYRQAMEQGMTTETHRSTRRYRQPDGCTQWPHTNRRSAPAIQIVSYRISPNAGKKPETDKHPNPLGARAARPQGAHR